MKINYDKNNRMIFTPYWGDWMKRNTVIFECSGIGLKMLYSGSLGSKNSSKFSFRDLEIFKISRKSTCKIEICGQCDGHTWPFLRGFFAPIDPLGTLEFRIETFEGQMSNGVIWGQIFDFGLKIRSRWLIKAWVMKTSVNM